MSGASFGEESWEGKVGYARALFKAAYLSLSLVEAGRGFFHHRGSRLPEHSRATDYARLPPIYK